jgi:protein O-GlcNAc transferase
LSLEYVKDQFRAGNQEKAIDACKKFLQQSPSDQEALKLLAKMYGLRGDYKNAILVSKKCHQIYKDDSEVIYNLAFFERQSAHFQEAEKWIKTFLEIQPEAYEGWVALSEIQIKLENYEKSLEYSQVALKYHQNDPSIFFSRALCLKQLKNHEGAISELNILKKLTPDAIEVFVELGENFLHVGNHETAFENFNKALNYPPKDPESLLVQTRAKLALGNIFGVLNDYNILIRNNYKLLEVLMLKARLLMHTRDFYSAIPVLINACELGNKEALINLCECYYDLGNHQEAISYINLYLSANKDNPNALIWKAKNLFELNKREDAIPLLLKAIELDPDLPFALSFLVHQLQYLCSWKDLNFYKEKLKKAIEHNQAYLIPFIALSLFDDVSIQQKVVRHYLDYLKIKQVEVTSKSPEKKLDDEKIKIGYYSPDFGQHPVSYLAVELFELHDRSKFEVFAFSFNKMQTDEFCSRVKNSFDHFIDVSTQSDEEIVSLSHQLGIDIAVDLCGMTAKNRFQIFAKRVAAVQVSYLGYLGTLGGLVDYIIADKILIPPQNREFYSEKIIYLPSYQINDCKKMKDEELITRKELGIPPDCFVYGSLNNSYKLTPEIFAVWMELLKEVPNSVLALFAPDDKVKKNLFEEIKQQSIDANRIIFFERVLREKYFSYLKLIDLFLDTPIYGAGTTASDALWMGVPVLTIQGNSMPSRIASSVLQSFGMPELITDSLDEYKFLAKHLAQDGGAFEKIKNKIESLIDQCLLFDSVRNTKYIENAFEIILKKHKEDSPIDHVVISE